MKLKQIIRLGMLSAAMLFGANTWAQCPSVWYFDAQDSSSVIYDTTVNCANPEIILRTSAFVPVATFNGNYLVESIPYNPPEPFTAGTKLPVSTDDVWDANGGLDIDFPFQFFGVTKTHVTVGGNGIVQFSTSTGGTGYAWDTYYPLNPTTANPTQFPHKNVILGVASDIDPGLLSGSGVNNASTRGIYKYAGGTMPCRHICFSWNEVPVFGHSNAVNTYTCTHQIVMYEGTNIIEIHIKRHHSHGTAGGGNRSAIGILNANGTKACMAPGRNPMPASGVQSCIEPDPCDSCASSEAWRFTPLGTTRQNKTWWKYEGTDAAVLTQTQVENLPESAWTQISHLTDYQDNGINNPSAYLPDLSASGTSADDTNLVVAPVTTTIYRCNSNFVGGTGYLYQIKAFARVKVDTSNITNLVCNDTAICYGANPTVQLNFPFNQTLQNAVWTVQKIEDGDTLDDNAERYSIAPNQRQLLLSPRNAADVTPNKIDTVLVSCMAEYTNGCRMFKTMRVLTYPNFDIHVHDTICENGEYQFNGQTYNLAGNYEHRLQSQPGCDSIVTLHLATLGVTTFDDHQKSCNEYTWPNNNQTYYSSTTTPQVTLTNKFGCDSVVTLKLEIIPVTAQISLSPTGATLDNLNIRLTDISVGNDSREWTSMFDGETSQSYIWNYAYPSDQDSVIIRLRAISNLGCSDTAFVTIPMLKESLWVPNVFSPVADYPNNVFKPIGVGLTQMEIDIFNRQGQLIRHLEGLDAYWDGVSEEGLECPQGAYVYRLRYANMLNPDATLIKTGTITLLR